MLEPVSGATYLQFSTKQPQRIYQKTSLNTRESYYVCGAGYLNAAPPRKKTLLCVTGIPLHDLQHSLCGAIAIH